MRISVRVTPGAKHERVQKLGETSYAVSVKERPKENEANFAVMNALAAHFGVSRSRIRLVQGRTSRDKVFDIVP